MLIEFERSSTTWSSSAPPRWRPTSARRSMSRPLSRLEVAGGFELRVRDEDGGEQPFTPRCRPLVADALGTLAAARRGEPLPTPSPAARSCARRPRP